MLKARFALQFAIVTTLIAPAALAQQITVYSGGTLAIGVGAAIPQVFPNIANFPTADVGFMG